MALHFDIRVNGNTIGYVNIQRQEVLTDNVPALYHVSVEYPMGVERQTRVRHLYERGAVSLIVAALEEIERLDPFIDTNTDR